jgi:hypothetical protein
MLGLELLRKARNYSVLEGLRLDIEEIKDSSDYMVKESRLNERDQNEQSLSVNDCGRGKR